MASGVPRLENCDRSRTTGSADSELMSSPLQHVSNVLCESHSPAPVNPGLESGPSPGNCLHSDF
jgi:hypothetical protein